MINWIPIVSFEQLQEIEERSKVLPCIIFKHSISCSISALAKHRLENYWDVTSEIADFYYLDLIRFRNLSNAISENYQVRHESPQLLMIRNGVCVYHTSHLDITVHQLKEQLGQIGVTVNT
ncbi:MAG: bacillithiol system redox-active protein YtxJ [Saprospiraceae bacterium]